MSQALLIQVSGLDAAMAMLLPFAPRSKPRQHVVDPFSIALQSELLGGLQPSLTQVNLPRPILVVYAGP